MTEFDESELQQLIEYALNENSSDSSHYLGFGETDLLEILYQKLSYKVIGSELSDIFSDLRKDILSRKVSLSLKDLHTITKNCKKCSIDSSVELPKWNSENPDILVVIESPSLPPDAISLMVNCFKKVGLSSDTLCLTYVNRCPVKRKYENSEIINCVPYLHSEIQLINPKLVLCMGGLPSSVIFGKEVKIKDFRGRINWLGYWPILSTYSPSYVLKSNQYDQFETDLQQALSFVSNLQKADAHAN